MCDANVGSNAKFKYLLKTNIISFVILRQVDFYNLYVDPKRHFSHD
jgi:hypothetical protein